MPRTVWHAPRDPAVAALSEAEPGSVGIALSRSVGRSGAGSSRDFLPLFLAGGLGLGAILLSLAAIPRWAVRPARASLLIEHWRVQIAATGLSAVAMALIVFLLGTSRL